MADDVVLRERVRAIIENKYLTTTERADQIIAVVHDRRKELAIQKQAEYL